MGQVVSRHLGADLLTATQIEAITVAIARLQSLAYQTDQQIRAASAAGQISNEVASAALQTVYQARQLITVPFQVGSESPYSYDQWQQELAKAEAMILSALEAAGAAAKQAELEAAAAEAAAITQSQVGLPSSAADRWALEEAQRQAEAAAAAATQQTTQQTTAPAQTQTSDETAPSGFDFSNIPMWAWIAGGVGLFFMLKGRN